MSTTAITAAVVESAGGAFEIGPADLGEVHADEVRVRMTASGICHTDLLIREGTFPIDRLIRVYDFDQINEAGDAALAGDVVKPVLRMG